jgi:endoglucanase
MATLTFCSKKEGSITIIPDESSTNDSTLIEPINVNLHKVNNRQIVDNNGNPTVIKGVAFSNYIWEDGPLHNPDHHSAIDYQRVRDMGMNVVRFYLNYSYLEDDTKPYTYLDSGWKWLDDNIKWAKENDVYLILNMHAPQGGYQSQGNGDALWDIPENQNRLSALWKEIARRYRAESQILGYGLVNEPIPTQSLNQWKDLAQRLTNDIRAEQDNHILFIENALYVKNGDSDSENFNFPEVSGTNLVYEFHFYSPILYTHQLLNFTSLGDGGKYPDNELFEISNGEWYTGIFENPQISRGNSDWTFYEGVNYTVNDANIDYAVPTLYASRTDGRIYFDDITVSEYDEDGVFSKEIYSENLNEQSSWAFWSQNNTGNYGVSDTEGNGDSGSLFIEGTENFANLGNFSERFIPKQGYTYKVDAWLKGERINTDADAKVGLDFFSVDGELEFRNKAFLQKSIKEIVDWSISKKCAIYLGEFGTGSASFENDKGGLLYVSDMLDIINNYNIPFTYHAYHEEAFGLYKGYGPPDPSNTNQALINLLTSKLK